MKKYSAKDSVFWEWLHLFNGSFVTDLQTISQFVKKKVIYCSEYVQCTMKVPPESILKWICQTNV